MQGAGGLDCGTITDLRIDPTDRLPRQSQPVLVSQPPLDEYLSMTGGRQALATAV